MPEGQRALFTAQRFKNINLDAGIGNVILSTHNMRDAHFKVIHHRREGIKRRTIGADQHRV